ncbi:LuxR C-terminal-related transcriptional regulator [Nonomuraea sp. NPDC005983]|uniref:ATP-binding protein n=1 Tax=Nonomuraea sp. NPDC005983 TaxID=3155595 RepID=UPI0033A74155
MEHAPAEVTSFVGRKRERSQAKSLLSDTRLLTLTGAGGVGKTRLVLRLAEEVSRAFPDGVWLVELAPLRDGELLPSTVADALGLHEQATRSPTGQLLDYLADKRLLLVLDNCEHLIESCGQLVAKLMKAAPGVRILATSRQALGVPGETVFTVPPLPVPEPGTPIAADVSRRDDAVQLLAERVAAVSPDFAITSENSEMVTRICRRLDGIPLAIELAAVQMRSLPMARILERLDYRFELLGKGRRGTLPRHQTLRAAIEWSYELCSADEKLLWRRMSVFVGACDLEAIEYVCSGGPIAAEDIFELVAGLVDKSIIFLQPGGDQARYRLLETIREFGAELLDPAEAAVVHARHWQYYRDLIRRADVDFFAPRQMEWFVRLRADQPNLRAALEYSLTEPGEALAGLESTAALHIFWVAAGRLREGCQWLQRALDLNGEPTRARAHALYGCAYLLIVLGRIDAAMSMLKECRELGERLGDASACAYASLWTGAAVMYRGDYSGAIPLQEAALAGHRSLDDPFGIYFALRHLSMAATAAGDPRAESFEEECLAVCEAHGADLSRSWALWVIGLGKWRRGDVAAAAARVREALRLKAVADDLAGEAYCLELLAWATDDTKRAVRLYGAAHTIWEKVGSTLVDFGYIKRFRDPFEQRVRRELSDDVYQSLLREGRELSIDDAIGYALREEEPDGAPSAAEADTSKLTPREREIAELISQGLSNKEIATRLVISQRTAEGHVEHILAKLGFSSRTQIAVWFAENPG